MEERYLGTCIKLVLHYGNDQIAFFSPDSLLQVILVTTQIWELFVFMATVSGGSFSTAPARQVFCKGASRRGLLHLD